MNNYITPGVYVKEVEISTYYPPKNWIRIKKIVRIFCSENKLQDI